MAAEHNPVFDMYRTNLAFVLRLQHLAQENLQHLHQFEVKAADRAIDANRKMTDALSSAKDDASLTTLSTSLLRQQMELATGFWQDFFAVVTSNRLALLNGVREAVEDLQAKNTEAYQGSVLSKPSNLAFEDMFKPFEPFANALAAYSKPAKASTANTRADSHSG